MSQVVGEGRGGVQGTAERLSALAVVDDEDGAAEDAGDDEERSRRVMGLKSGTGSARWESFISSSARISQLAGVYYPLSYYYNIIYYCYYY